MSTAETTPETPESAPDEPSGTIDNPETTEPPARPSDGFKRAMLEERRKRQDLESRLAEIERAEAEAKGEYRELAEKERKRAESASERATRLERALALTDAGIADPTVREFALFKFEQADSDDFDAFVESSRDELQALLKPADKSEPEPEPEPDRPTGTRAAGKRRAEIPADIVREAERHKMDPEKWYQIRQRAKERAERSQR